MEIMKANILSGIYFLVGLMILSVNKVRYINGYRNPRGFSSSDVNRSIQHDVLGLQEIERMLCEYAPVKYPFHGKTILELGPGPDIGMGAFLLEKGAHSYCGFDKYNLMKSISDDFYSTLENLITKDDVKRQLDLFKSKASSRIRYVVDPEFSLRNFPREKYNLIISRSAFEHFDDVERTLTELSEIAQPGALLNILVNLKTHSRWIRDKDPNNIYRYPEWLYRKLRYPGVHNRVRPEHYEEILKRTGWCNVNIRWRNNIAIQKGRSYLPGLSSTFKSYNMDIMSCNILATRM